MTPRLWVFAGPNGAGKSTVVEQYVGHRLPIINPDNIARNLPSDLSAAARIGQAGRAAVRERANLLAERQSFGIETTLTGRSELDLMHAATRAGYHVNLVFIGLRDVQHSIARVGERVRMGGHDVPLADILRRFDRSVNNLGKAAKIANHRVIVLDNSGTRRRLIFTRKGQRIRYQSPDMPFWAAALQRDI